MINDPNSAYKAYYWDIFGDPGKWNFGTCYYFIDLQDDTKGAKKSTKAKKRKAARAAGIGGLLPNSNARS